MAIADPREYASGVEGKNKVQPFGGTAGVEEIPTSEWSLSFSCPTADMTNSKSQGFKEGSRGVVSITGSVTLKPLTGLQLTAATTGIVLGSLVEMEYTLDTGGVFEGLGRITGGGAQTGPQATPGYTYTFEGHGVWTGPMMPAPVA